MIFHAASLTKQEAMTIIQELIELLPCDVDVQVVNELKLPIASES